MAPLTSKRSKLLLAISTAALALSVSAGAAFAGEITGTGESLEPLHAKSICAYSGLNDDPEGLDPENGPPGRTQSFGQVVRVVGPIGGVPGFECRGNLAH